MDGRSLEPVGVESQRVGPQRGVAMDHPLREHDRLAPAHDASGELDVLLRQPADGPGGREEPHRFREDTLQVRKPFHVARLRRSSLQRRIDLGLDPRLDLAMLRQ